MIRQMMRKVIVLEGNDTSLNPGMQVSLTEMTKINREALLSGKRPATFSPVLLGISKSSVETDSFLSAASFQETTKVLTDAAIKAKKDHLIGLKENVIVGKMIPAGTGCNADRETSRQIAALAAELREKRLEKQKQDDDIPAFMNFVPQQENVVAQEDLAEMSETTLEE